MRDLVSGFAILLALPLLVIVSSSAVAFAGAVRVYFPRRFSKVLLQV